MHVLKGFCRNYVYDESRGSRPYIRLCYDAKCGWVAEAVDEDHELVTRGMGETMEKALQDLDTELVKEMPY